MTLVPDLVQVSKLETQFDLDSDCTQHVRYTCGNTSRKKIRQEERWRREKEIGGGGGGVIWLERCLQENNERSVRAVKKVRKFDSSAYYRELEAMALFSHSKYDPCFVKFFGWYESSDSIFIAMEYVLHGDLHQYLGSPLPEKEGQNITFQILEGLRFMHDSGFVHRDLKPANILVQHKGPDWWVKIGDFGISKRASESWTRTGTPAFSAARSLPLWSIGRSVHQRCGYLVFGCYYILHTHCFEFPSNSLLANGISKPGLDFMQRSTTPKPEKRLRVQECLQHPWLISFMEDFTPETPRKTNVSKVMTTQQSHSSPEPSASWSTLVPISTHESDSFPNVLAEKTSQQVTAHSVSEPKTRIDWHRKFVLGGHMKLIRNVKFSPNGKKIVSASFDRTIRLWYSATGTPCDILEGHRLQVMSATFSPDGQQIASASEDKTIRLWKSVTGMTRGILRGHSDGVRCVTFSPNGEQIASASADNTIRLGDPVTARTRNILRGHSGAVWHVAYSPNGKQIASASSDRKIILWDLVTKTPSHILHGHSDVVTAVTFSPNGKQIVSASWDRRIIFWDSITGTLLHVLTGHSDEIRSVRYSPDGRQIASASRDGTIRVWDSLTDTTRILATHRGGVFDVAFSPNGQQMASASYDKTIAVWQSVAEVSDALRQGLPKGWKASKATIAPDTDQHRREIAK